MLFKKILEYASSPKTEARYRSFFNMDKKPSDYEQYPSVKTDPNAEEFYENNHGDFESFEEAADYYEDHHSEK